MVSPKNNLLRDKYWYVLLVRKREAINFGIFKHKKFAKYFGFYDFQAFNRWLDQWKKRFNVSFKSISRQSFFQNHFTRLCMKGLKIISFHFTPRFLNIVASKCLYFLCWKKSLAWDLHSLTISLTYSSPTDTQWINTITLSS